MTTFRYVPLDAATVSAARESFPAQISDDDSAPCRSCLRLTPRGTKLILFAHRPFTTHGPYAETGPVFVHADACEPYRGDAFPPDFRPRTLVFRAYGTSGAIRDATLASGSDAETTLERLFADSDVTMVHVRNPAWGCFDFAVERGD